MSTPPPKRILILDDHFATRKGLAIFLVDAGFEIYGEVQTEAELITAMRQPYPDIAILDIQLATGADGIQIAATVRKHFPSVKTVMLSMHDDPIYVSRALRAGARGYVLKGSQPSAVTDAIRTVLEGGTYVDPRLSGPLLALTPSAGPGLEAQLSDQQLHVFRLTGHGLAPRVIAERLGISRKSVQEQKLRIRTKLGLPSMEELNYLAQQWVREHDTGKSLD